MVRRMRPAFVLLAAVVVAIGAVLAFVAGRFSPERYKPAIEAAVKHATGRDLVVRGPSTLSFGWSPVLVLRDLTLANAEGGSRPEMATVGRADAELSLLPLMFGRLVVNRLTLVHPDILLERSARGEPNWHLSPFVPGQPLPDAAESLRPGPAPDIAIAALRITDGRVVWHGPGGDITAALPLVEARSPSADDPIRVAGQVAFGPVPVTVDGEVGSWSGAQDLDRRTPWPVRLAVTTADAHGTLAGGVTRPLQLRGYAFKLDATAQNLQTLQPFFPATRLPALRDVAVAAQLAESGTGGLEIAALTVRAGASDLSGYADGLSVARLEFAMPRVDRPVHGSVEGDFAGTPLRIAASFGAPGALFGGNQIAGSSPVDVSAVIGGATVIARGTIADPGRLTGADIAVSARVPDLDALSPLAGRTLPPLKSVVFMARLRDRDGGLSRGVAMRDLKLTSAQGDLAGEVALGFAATPSVNGTLTSGRMDLDALLAAVAPASGTPPEDSAGATSRPAPIIPDTPLPFDRIRAAEADLRFKIASLLAGGTTYRDAVGRLVIGGGKLRLDPMTAQAPGGGLNARLLVDTTQPEPAMALTLRMAGVPLRAMLGAAGLPEDASGTAELDLDVRGTGNSPRAIAAGGTGHLGVAAINGRLGGRVLAVLLSDPLRRAGLPTPRLGGQSDLVCLAARADLVRGTATVRNFYLDAGDAQLEATGTIALGDDTALLLLTPTVRGGDAVPIRLTGPIRDPKASVAGGPDTGPDRRANLPRRLTDPGVEACTRPLTIARDGRPGPMPVSLATLAPLPFQPPPASLVPFAGAATPIPLTPPTPLAAPAQAPPRDGRKPVDLFQFMR